MRQVRRALSIVEGQREVIGQLREGRHGLLRKLFQGLRPVDGGPEGPSFGFERDQERRREALALEERRKERIARRDVPGRNLLKYRRGKNNSDRALAFGCLEGLREGAGHPQGEFDVQQAIPRIGQEQARGKRVAVKHARDNRLQIALDAGRSPEELGGLVEKRRVLFAVFGSVWSIHQIRLFASPWARDRANVPTTASRALVRSSPS